MKSIDDLLKSLPAYIGARGEKIEKIEEAERELDLKFTTEFKDYLLNIGIASIDGHEFTGICDNDRLNVVNVTKNCRVWNASIPYDWYVIEETNIDDIVYWQCQSGEIYMSIPGYEHTKVCESFAEYIKKMKSDN